MHSGFGSSCLSHPTKTVLRLFLLTSSPLFMAGIPTVVLQLLRWVRVADRLTARFTWHALRASPALIKV